MWRRLRGLFLRYCAQNLVIVRRGFVLEAQYRNLGRVTRIARRGNRLEVAGYVCAPAVTLHWGEDHATAPTRAAPLCDADGRSFLVDLPVVQADAPLSLSLAGSAAPAFELPQISKRSYVWAQLQLLPGFVWRLMRALPLILQWARSKDPALRPQIRATLGFWTLPAAGTMKPDLFAVTETRDVPHMPFTCILPVYNAFDLLPEVLARVEAHSDLPCHLVIIEDCSPDERVRPFLRDWVAVAGDRVELIENADNLGFIGSVNRGIEVALARGGPVVLLNSDALVPKGWASRLLAPIFSDPAVASTTPMSNDAEIFSVPVICMRSSLAPGQADALDTVARGFAPGTGDASAPTGVGFCMGISGDWLAKVPALDTVFGLGYGEEVDWCQKTHAMGARHLGVANLFVEHRGGASFGKAEKQRLLALNAERISTRYPDYDTQVQDYLRADPMVTPRLALAVAWLASCADGTKDRAAVPVYLSHAMGGGVAHYLETRLAQDIADRQGAVVLRIGARARWRLEVHTGHGVTMGETDDFALIEAILAPLGQRHIVYVCGVGDTDPASLPDRLLDLLRVPDTGRATLEVMFHDFFPLSPSFNLLGQDGVFQGVPADDNPDPVHNTPVPLSVWRASWRRVIARADTIVTFAQDGRGHVLAVYPDAADRVEVVPHRFTQDIPVLAPGMRARQVIAIPGNLNMQKGAALVAEMARQLKKNQQDFQLLVLGDTDPACPPLPGVTVHGPYRRDDFALLARRYGVTGWLIASVWPETFSYTTHEALATGLPVFCLDLGAQAEAVRAAGEQGHIIAHTSDIPLQARNVLAALRAGRSALH